MIFPREMPMPSTIPTSTAIPDVTTVRFADFGLDDSILRALIEQGYETPTPIQAQAIPVVLQGKDVMGAAQTGTGKTAGFSLPMIQKLLPFANTSTSPARHPVRGLILTPTRELADQVADNVRTYAKHTSLRSAVIFGGVDMNPQTVQLRAGVEILIATPGRLLDHVQQKTLNLSQASMLVLDEADRMLDMGFLPDLQRILNLLPKERQTLLFSATFSNEIKKLANSYLVNPTLIEVARRNATSENITQKVFEVSSSEDKRAAVAQLIREHSMTQVIVFSNSKLGASRLARELEKAGVKAAPIHGDKTQSERMAALEAFKNGTVEVLVATDVAARGLDITDLPYVINYDLPFSAEDYVHRIGRTGRAGAQGSAFSLSAPGDERLLTDIEKLIKTKLLREPMTVDKPSRGQRDAGDAAERSESRSEGRGYGRSDSRSDNRYDGASSGSGGGSAGSRGRRFTQKQPVDEFFFKPYEPSDTASNVVHAAPVSSKSGVKRPVAALLGGLKNTGKV